MFRKNELELLRMQKELLVTQGDVQRLLLAAEWRQLRSSKNWVGESCGLARSHPIWVSLLGAAAGVLAIKAFSKTDEVSGVMGRMGKYASLALTAWRLFRRMKNSQ